MRIQETAGKPGNSIEKEGGTCVLCTELMNKILNGKPHEFAAGLLIHIIVF